MAITTDRIIGRQLTVTADGAKTKWENFSLTFSYNEEGASAADSTLDEIVHTTKMVSGECSGLMGSVNNAGTLPEIGDTIADLAVAVGADTVIPSLTAYTNIKVTEVGYDFKQGPATFNFKFRSGVLN